MNNHDFEMCCGTTCDKHANAEYVARLEREHGDMVDRIAPSSRRWIATVYGV